MRSPLWSLPLLVAVVTVTGCEGQDCTLIGGINGVGVEIPEELWVAEGAVEFIVCDDDDCASVTRRLRRVPRGTQVPVGRESTATFEDLGRSFAPGTVTVTVELRDAAGTLVAEREEAVELTRSYPNGKSCDGDGYVSGGFDLVPEDAVAAR